MINPNIAQGHRARGSLYLQQGEWDLAIVDLDKALKIDPTDASIYFNRANAYLGKKQYDKALVDMLRAKEMGYKVNPGILEEIKRGL